MLSVNRQREEKSNSVERNLKYAKTDQELKPEANENNYVEVYRKQPKVSYSMSNTLEKFLEEERKKHNPSLNKLDKTQSQSQFDKMTVGGGQLVDTISNKENVISLKSALKDPSFVQKIGQLEDRRQQLYLNILKKRGQLVVGPDGTQTIVSYPKVFFSQSILIWNKIFASHVTFSRRNWSSKFLSIIVPVLLPRLMR